VLALDQKDKREKKSLMFPCLYNPKRARCGSHGFSRSSVQLRGLIPEKYNQIYGPSLNQKLKKVKSYEKTQKNSDKNCELLIFPCLNNPKRSGCGSHVFSRSSVQLRGLVLNQINQI
jgi:hypothetical protein